VPKAKIALIAVLIFLLVWLSIYNPPFLDRFRLSVIRVVTLPLRLAYVASFAVKDFMEARIHSKWIRQNRVLKNRINELSFEMAKLKELEAESARLKELLEFKRQYSKKSVPARIVGMDSAILSRSVIIDKGESDGIGSGMAVISKSGIVGRVIEVNARLSRVMLLEDPDFRLGAVVQRTRERALFVGGPRPRARIIYLGPNSDVREGDVVTSFPSHKRFPKGLLLGYVDKIDSNGIVMYKSATVRTAVDYSRLEEVLCIE